jgi:hypothetical protein
MRFLPAYIILGGIVFAALCGYLWTKYTRK